MLLLQFLVGLALSRVGLPAATSGFAKVAAIVLLALHLLLTIGLIASAIICITGAGRLPKSAAGVAWGGFVAVLVAVATGVLFYMTGSDWWSYLMGAAATIALPLYGILYLRSMA